MITAEGEIAWLDQELEGLETVTLTRNTLGPAGALIPASIDLPAMAASYDAHELVGLIAQGDVRVIFSPTQIEATGWPGGAPQRLGALAKGIPTKGDTFTIAGHLYTVQAPAAVRRIGGRVVRLEAQVRG